MLARELGRLDEGEVQEPPPPALERLAVQDLRVRAVGQHGRQVGGVGLDQESVDRHGGQRLPGGLATATAVLDEAHIPYETGGHTDRLLDVDFLVVSPGVPTNAPILVAARSRRIPIHAELEVASWVCRAPIIAVTGSNGKTTTTTLIARMIDASGRSSVSCGNIGRPLSDVVDTLSRDAFAVVEVSSYQLETIDRFRPAVALILNLQPDHLERHGDFAGYGAAKQRLFARQDETDYAVWNADDPEVMARRTGGGTWLEFSATRVVEDGAAAVDGRIRLGWRGGMEELMGTAELRLRGRHNVMNALAAVTTVLPLEPAPDALRAVLREYGGLEHRLEPVATVAGVPFVNDSKATNTSSREVALLSFESPVVLIAGGRDKGQDFAPLAPLVRERTRAVVLIGEGADRIASHWPGATVLRAGSLAEAVETAFAAARTAAAGPAPVLLSPGCASFDMFADFEDRGRRFKEEVARLAAREGGS